MAVHLKYKVVGGDFSHAGHASSEVRRVLKDLNVEPKKIKSIVVALYEAEVNIVAHAYEGEIRVTIDTEQIQIELEDKGPGIENIELAMQEGFSTASEAVREMGFGAGLGLSNMRKNADELHISSKYGEWTKVVIKNFL
jgi:anti-sigma regulatory factor (Ser/Thr protein kinase)